MKRSRSFSSKHTPILFALVAVGTVGSTSRVDAQESTDTSGAEVSLRNLEEDVSELKEKIFRSKARLLLMRETVLHSKVSGAKARIFHKNEMGSSFVLDEVRYSLDGAPILSKKRHENVPIEDELELLNGSMIPGDHNLSVYLVYKGNGYGVFSYLNDYVFRVRSSCVFRAEEGKSTTLDVITYEKGGFTANLQDRPGVKCALEVTDNKVQMGGEAPAEAPSGS